VGALPRCTTNVPGLVDMNREGCFSGDLHLHRAPNEMPLLLRAEDLNVGPVVACHLGAKRRPSLEVSGL